jgi:hypothetical protein
MKLEFDVNDLAHFSRNPPVIVGFYHAFSFFNDGVEVVLIARFISYEFITFEFGL